MVFRFRYLGPTGREVEVASLEGLRALVRDGTVGEATLLFDALTHEWAPARAHTVYRSLRDGSPPPSPPAQQETTGRHPAVTGMPAPVHEDDSLGLSLTFSIEEPDEAPDAEQAALEILKAREREDDRPVRADGIISWTITPPAAPTEPPAAASPGAPTPPEKTASPAPFRDQPASPPPPRVRPERLVFRSAIPEIPPPLPELRTAWQGEAQPTRPPLLFVVPQGPSLSSRLYAWLHDLGSLLIDTAGAHAVLPRLLVLAGLFGLLLMLLATVRSSARQPDPAILQSASIVPDVGRMVSSLGSARTSGFQNMVAGVDSLRRAHDVLQVPSIWLEGKYLADAPRYPEVKEYWTRYRAFLADVRANDTVLYRAGFVAAMRGQGVTGTQLTLQLSQAMRDFGASQPQREEVYRHMEELSSAALQLHALLVDRAADITYEPAIQHGVSRAPVVEAMAEDTVLRDHMWTLLERIFASLDWFGGESGGSRDNLTDRLMQGIQASAH